jgi:hypothetical protein
MSVKFTYYHFDTSYPKALKQIVAFDRQYISQPPINHIPIDRASFGLA